MRKMVARRLLLPCLIFLHASSLAGTASYLLGTAETLSPSIRVVQSCGTWEQEKHSGYYRVILGDVHGGAGSELYVQWISVPTQDKPAEVVQTLSFPELNDDHAQYWFKSVECRARGKSVYLRLSGQYEHDEPGTVRDVTIRLIDIGHYQLTERRRKLR